MLMFDYSTQADVLRAINSIPILSGIGVHEQHVLASRCHVEEAEPDEVMIEQDAVGDRLYFILKGTVLICKKSGSGGWIKVNTLSAGEVFGEIAILRNVPRTARVMTLTHCTFLTITGKDFLEVYQYFPAASRDNIQLVIAKRLQQLKDSR